MGFSLGQVRYGFSVTKEIDSKMFFGVKGLYPTLFPGGRSVTTILFNQSESVCSKPVSASGLLRPHSCPLGLCTAIPHSRPLGLSAQLSRPAILWASLHSHSVQPSSGPWSSALPPLQPLLCSPAALQPCHHVAQSTGQGSLYSQ